MSMRISVRDYLIGLLLYVTIIVTLYYDRDIGLFGVLFLMAVGFPFVVRILGYHLGRHNICIN